MAYDLSPEQKVHWARFSALIEEAKSLLIEAEEGKLCLDKLKNMADQGLEILILVENLEIAMLDMHLMEILFSIFHLNIRTIHPERFSFNKEEFARRIIRHVGEIADNVSHKKMVKILAESCGRQLYGSTPHCDVFLGGFEVTEPFKKAVKQREKRVKDKIEPVKNPEKVDKVEGHTLEQTVLRIENILRKACVANNNQPVNYFKFVLHPTSFATSVENIFHVAFLINSNTVCINIDKKTNMPTIEPNRHKADTTREGKSAMAICIDMSEWKEAVSAFNITKPMIVLPNFESPSAGSKRKN